MDGLPCDLVRHILAYETPLGRWVPALMRADGSTWHALFKWALFNTDAGLVALWRAVWGARLREQAAQGPLPEWLVHALRAPTPWYELRARIVAVWPKKPLRGGGGLCPAFLAADAPLFTVTALQGTDIIDAVRPLVCAQTAQKNGAQKKGGNWRVTNHSGDVLNND